MLTPEEISSRKFLNALRGYDRLEVSEFLNEVAEDYRNVLQRLEELEAREKQREAQREGFDPREAIGELGEETKRILLAAEEAAEEKRTKAEEDAKAELEQARKTAAEELEQARSTAAEELDAARRKVQTMIHDAEERRDEILARIKALTESRDTFAGQLSEAIDGVRSTLNEVDEISAPEVGDGDGDATASEAAVTEVAEDAGSDAEVAKAAETDESTGDDETVVQADQEPDEAAAPNAAEESVETASSDETPTTSDETPTTRVEGESDAAVEAGQSTPTTEVEDETAESAGGTDVPAATAGGEQSEAGSGNVKIVQPSGPSGSNPVELRSAALDDIRPAMVQELKRTIQSMERGLLDRLREAEDAESTVSPSEDEAAALVGIGETHLARAYAAGLDAAATLADTGMKSDGNDARVKHGSVELRDTIIDEMRATLERTLNEGADRGESAAQLSRRVKKAVKRLRNAVAEASASTSLLRVYELGVHDGWSEANVPARTWVLAEEVECPDDVCATNAGEGAVALDAAFPSGDVAPPAHPGCVCSLTPA